ncbi:MAG TPA: CoA pyrophosphatase, partial [Cellvibrionaceae bacterium]
MFDPRWQALQARLTPIAHLPDSPEGFHRQAAVLVPIVTLANPELILTRRAAHLASHAGEIAFPGGRWEPDDQTLLHTALRESHEEIALPPHAVIPLGTLPVYCTRAGVRVTPVVGLVPEQQAFVPQLAELDSIFTVPLHFFSAANAT